jgi:hypothetical protein
LEASLEISGASAGEISGLWSAQEAARKKIGLTPQERVLENVSQHASLQKEGEVWQNDDLKCGRSNGPITSNWTWLLGGVRGMPMPVEL